MPVSGSGMKKSGPFASRSDDFPPAYSAYRRQHAIARPCSARRLSTVLKSPSSPAHPTACLVLNQSFRRKGKKIVCIALNDVELGSDGNRAASLEQPSPMMGFARSCVRAFVRSCVRLMNRVADSGKYIHAPYHVMMITCGCGGGMTKGRGTAG